MKDFEYYSPIKMFFGNGQRKNIGQILGSEYKRPLLVMNKGPFRENGAYADIKKAVETDGRVLIEMTDIDSNPRLSSAREGAEVCRKNNVDCIIAVGGGSAMDCAKVIGASAVSGIDPYEYLWGDRPEVTKSLPVITVPTIAATGAEANPSAVIVNDDTKEKYYCDGMFPIACVMDPELTMTVPIKLTLWGGMDILSHTYEYYFNGDTDSEWQMRFSEAILMATMSALETLVKDPLDLNARGELMWCSIMAWGGLTKIGRGEPDMACHGIEESFSGWFDTHHGACLGVLTPRWMEIVSQELPKPFARFGRNVLEEDDTRAAKKAVSVYKKWLKAIGAPNTYFDIGDKAFDDKELAHVAATSCRIYKGGVGRLRRFNEQEVLELLKKGKEAY
jgi:alcohol dehydrogenase YqhD (iron-dependent ADH family)